MCFDVLQLCNIGSVTHDINVSPSLFFSKHVKPLKDCLQVHAVYSAVLNVDKQRGNNAYLLLLLPATEQLLSGDGMVL